MSVVLVECPICLVDIHVDKVTTACKHTFHRSCIARWQKREIRDIRRRFETSWDGDIIDVRSSCPVCRGSLDILFDRKQVASPGGPEQYVDDSTPGSASSNCAACGIGCLFLCFLPNLIR